MKIEYDTTHDLLYVNLAPCEVKSHWTETIAPGVFVDFDGEGRVIGIELLDASTVIGPDPRVEFELRPCN